jgi:hypothetical protein
LTFCLLCSVVKELCVALSGLLINACGEWTRPDNVAFF